MSHEHSPETLSGDLANLSLEAHQADFPQRRFFQSTLHLPRGLAVWPTSPKFFLATVHTASILVPEAVPRGKPIEAREQALPSS
jgi:hypothetical protein